MRKGLMWGRLMFNSRLMKHLAYVSEGVQMVWGRLDLQWQT